MPYTVHVAKNNISKLLKRVSRGESVTITNRRTAVARLVPVRAKKRELGFFAGQIHVARNFDAPLEEFDDDEGRG